MIIGGRSRRTQSTGEGLFMVWYGLGMFGAAVLLDKRAELDYGCRVCVEGKRLFVGTEIVN